MEEHYHTLLIGFSIALFIKYLDIFTSPQVQLSSLFNKDLVDKIFDPILVMGTMTKGLAIALILPMLLDLKNIYLFYDQDIYASGTAIGKTSLLGLEYLFMLGCFWHFQFFSEFVANIYNNITVKSLKIIVSVLGIIYCVYFIITETLLPIIKWIEPYYN